MNIRIAPVFTFHVATWHNPKHLMIYFRVGFDGLWFYVQRTAPGSKVRTKKLWTYGLVNVLRWVR